MERLGDLIWMTPDDAWTSNFENHFVLIRSINCLSAWNVKLVATYLFGTFLRMPPG